MTLSSTKNNLVEQKESFTPSQEKIILAYTHCSEALTQSQLSRTTGVFYATVHKSTQKLVELGIMRRQGLTGRKIPLLLTDRGGKLWLNLKEKTKLLQQKR
jgi:DNA-binding MarR family transcriptional regulator